MAFHIVIQTRAIQPISSDQRALLEAIIFPLLETWAPVALFPGEKKFLTSYDNEQGLGSLMITIPFLTLHGNQFNEDVREEIVAILTNKLDEHNCFIYLTGNTKERYLLKIPGILVRKGFSYALDYCPDDPLYSVAKEADVLLQEITRIKNQIGSHTNDAVMHLLKPELNKLILRYNVLFKQPLSRHLVNRSQIEKAFRDTKKQYKVQRKKIKKSPDPLNKIAGNPVTSLPKEPVKIIFQFLTLKEMHTVSFLVSRSWIPITNEIIVLVLANKFTLPQALSETKQAPLSLLRGLACQLQTSILTGSKLNLDTAQQLIKNGFEHFNPTIKKDILKNTNLVNELMAKDHRFCYFFAKLMYDSFPNGAVKWTHQMQNNIDKLLNADDGLIEFFISQRCTGYFIQTFVEHADRLLTDLNKINLSLKKFICDPHLPRLFLKEYNEELRHPAENYSWQDFIKNNMRDSTPALLR